MRNDRWWGLNPPEGTEVAWSARAIYRTDGEYFGLVWDRQSSRGDEAALKALAGWLNGGALEQFEQLTRDELLRQDEDRVVRREEDGFVLGGDPRGSFGYCYLVAHPASWRARLCPREPRGGP